MDKTCKKLYFTPRSPAILLPAVEEDPGGLEFLYQASPPLDLDDANPGNSFRVCVPITGTSGTQIRVTIVPGSVNALTILHASIGKRNLLEPTKAHTTATPIQLLFGGVSGFVGATTPQTSDWANLSGLVLTDGDEAVAIYDIVGGQGPTVASQRRSITATGCSTFYKDTTSWDQMAPAITFNKVDGTVNYCISSVETQ